MLRKIIKLCETLLKVKEVFREAYKTKDEDFYDPSADELPIHYGDYGEILIAEDAES